MKKTEKQKLEAKIKRWRGRAWAAEMSARHLRAEVLVANNFMLELQDLDPDPIAAFKNMLNVEARAEIAIARNDELNKLLEQRNSDLRKLHFKKSAPANEAELQKQKKEIARLNNIVHRVRWALVDE